MRTSNVCRLVAHLNAYFMAIKKWHVVKWEGQQTKDNVNQLATARNEPGQHGATGKTKKKVKRQKSSLATDETVCEVHNSVFIKYLLCISDKGLSHDFFIFFLPSGFIGERFFGKSMLLICCYISHVSAFTVPEVIHFQYMLGTGKILLLEEPKNGWQHGESLKFSKSNTGRGTMQCLFQSQVFRSAAS